MPNTNSDYSGYLSDYSVKELGAYHMIGDDAYEPQRTNNFELHVYFDDDDSRKLRTIDQMREINSSEAENVLILSTVSVSGLGTQSTTIEVAHMNTRIKFAGVPTYNDLTVNFYDFIGKSTERILSAWYGQVHNAKSQIVGRKSIYGKRALLVETAPDGSMARAWQIFGMFPTNYSLGDYSAETNETRKVQLTLNCDYYYPIDSDTDYKNLTVGEVLRQGRSQMANSWDNLSNSNPYTNLPY